MKNLLTDLGTSGLGLAFLERAIELPDHTVLLDSTGADYSYKQLLTKSLAFAITLERVLAPFAEEPRVGIVLPPGTLGGMVNVALAMTRRASVNLNALAGPVSLREQMEQAKLRHVLLSRKAFDVLGGAALFESRALFVEDLLAAITTEDLGRARAVCDLSLADVRRISAAVEAQARVATLLFSSGSTARAKAIQLSHANVLSNARAVAQAFDFGRGDRLLGVLPFFHSFGYTVTLWTPLLAGASVIFHDNALDVRAIGEAAQTHRPTVLLATPALYQAWMRRIEREQFSSVRAAVVGAQRLQPILADAWFERFGNRLYEGYGCTEMSPVVSANLPERHGDVRQREGSVGRALQGIKLEIRDPKTGVALPSGVEGDVWVRGPGVMLGYLGDEAATRRAIVDGWYDTQDVGKLDSEGFLTLTDRRSRFSKIGGEMISHGAVECALSAAAVALGESSSQFALAVTAIADEQRGERLMVLHTPLKIGIDALLERARRDGLANLFTPRASDCIEVEALPQLASGKLDLGMLKRWASERRAHAT